MTDSELQDALTRIKQRQAKANELFEESHRRHGGEQGKSQRRDDALAIIGGGVLLVVGAVLGQLFIRVFGH